MRKFEKFDTFEIPGIIKGPGEILKGGIPLADRYKPYISNGKFLIIQGYDKFNTKKFVESILNIRIKNMDKIIYLPGPFNPYDFPVLFYLGIDLLDDSFIRIKDDKECILPFDIIKSRNCSEWNESLQKRIMEEIKFSAQTCNFRELVEYYSESPFSKEVLRTLDLEYYNEIEKLIDHKSKKLYSGSVESIYRPEFVEYRKRVSDLEQTADYLLLIPCSATKPYSRSKSHRILHFFISKYLKNIQEVIVTSPLGLVPREIESFYPAAYYDIPVTGFWFEDEKKMLLELAQNFFRNKKYKKIFYILPEGEDVILNLFDNPIGIIGKLNSENSSSLGKMMEDLSVDHSSSDNKKFEKEFSNVINYLYNIKIDYRNIEIKNQGNRNILIYKGEEFAKHTIKGIQPLHGLTKILYEKNIRKVEIKDIIKSSNIFVPVVKDISDDVRPGDQVIIVFRDQIIGFGTSEISRIDLNYLEKGLAVTDFRKVESIHNE